LSVTVATPRASIRDRMGVLATGRLPCCTSQYGAAAGLAKVLQRRVTRTLSPKLSCFGHISGENSCPALLLLAASEGRDQDVTLL
jgi:hypothetical protein